MIGEDLRMAGIERGRMLTMLVDGGVVIGYEGESIAAALVASGRRATRATARTGEPRGYFCGMGVCQDCLVTVDGRPNVRACMAPVRDGLRVEVQRGLGEEPVGEAGDAAVIARATRAVPAGRRGPRSLVGPRPMRSAGCVVIGGGPAGLAAARTAARYGVRVVLVDENAELGGQYHRQMPAGFRALGGPAHRGESDPGQALIAEVRALGVELCLGTVAWGIFDRRTVALATPEATERIGAEAIVLAPGAHDRPVPFPGWTLPRVLTAGGAQNLMKGYGVLPGRRVLVAGSGPLLLVVAQALLRGGAEVAAVCEAASMRGLWRYAHRMLPHLDVLQQGYRYHQEIRRAGVPYLTGHVIRRALGTTEVTGAVVSPCADDWTPLAGGERNFDVDAVVVGYGFVSSLELGRLAGCEHRWDAALGGWVPMRSREMESTVPDVFIAGDGGGLAGAAVALEEGHLAGLAVAARLGRLAAREYSREASRARGRLLHLAGFRRVMDEVYHFGPGLSALAEGATTLCRCEEITHEEALEVVREGATTANEVKAWTRVGMGRCQGRMCGPALAALIARATGRPVSEAGVFTPRPPAKPVPLAALAHEIE